MLLKGCCCCSLRHGALAVSVVYLTLSLLEVLTVLGGWGAADADWAYHYRKMMRARRFHPEERQYWSEYPDTLPGIEALVPLTFVAAIQLAFDLLLAWAVHISPTRARSARRYLLSWLIFRAVLFGLITIGDLALFISAVVMRYADAFASEAISVILGLSFVVTTIVCGAFWYSWLVVLSFFWQLCAADGTAVAFYLRHFHRLETVSLTTPEPLPHAEEPSVSGSGQSAGQTDGQK